MACVYNVGALVPAPCSWVQLNGKRTVLPPQRYASAVIDDGRPPNSHCALSSPQEGGTVSLASPDTGQGGGSAPAQGTTSVDSGCGDAGGYSFYRFVMTFI